MNLFALRWSYLCALCIWHKTCDETILLLQPLIACFVCANRTFLNADNARFIFWYKYSKQLLKFRYVYTIQYHIGWALIYVGAKNIIQELFKYKLITTAISSIINSTNLCTTIHMIENCHILSIPVRIAFVWLYSNSFFFFSQSTQINHCICLYLYSFVHMSIHYILSAIYFFFTIIQI